jgi:hypothetical protein
MLSSVISRLVAPVRTDISEKHIASSSIFKMEEICYSETSALLPRATQRHILEDNIFHRSSRFFKNPQGSDSVLGWGTVCFYLWMGSNCFCEVATYFGSWLLRQSWHCLWPWWLQFSTGQETIHQPTCKGKGGRSAKLTTLSGYVRFQVFTTVTVKNAVFLDVTPCGSLRSDVSSQLASVAS